MLQPTKEIGFQSNHHSANSLINRPAISGSKSNSVFNFVGIHPRFMVIMNSLPSVSMHMAR